MPFSKAEYQQYHRHLILDEIGESGQLKLKQAKVLVIGAGGLGCPILQYLTAAGVGHIGIVDDDVVDTSNLQRQVLFTQNDLGKKKAEVAATRLQQLNPFAEFEVQATSLSPSNALSLFSAHDIIVDGTDNFPTRYLVNDAAALTNKPVVFGSIFKFDGQVSVFNYKGGPTYRCLYPTPPRPNQVPNCSEVGVLGVLPGIIGSLQANEVLKIILGLGKVLTGKLLTLDALSMQQQLFTFSKSNAPTITELQPEYQSFCGLAATVPEISFGDFTTHAQNYNVLDVRTPAEREVYHIASQHIPLDELEDRLHEIPENKKLVVYCKSGLRSKKAIELLSENGFKNELLSLKGGLPMG